MSLPITSRIKRSPLLQTATTVGGKKGEDKNIKGKKGTPKRTEKEAYELRGPEYKDMDFAAYQKAMRNDPLYGTSGTPDQPDKVVKGKDTSFEEPLYASEEYDVFQPTETRASSRAIKKEQRDIRRAKIKAAKKAGTLTPELRKQYKAEEAAAELEEFQAQATRQKKARASGKAPGAGRVYAGEREMGRSELGVEGQKELAARKANIITETSTPPETSAADEIEITPVTVSNTQESTPEATDTTEYGKYSAPTKMKSSAYKMKAKSPAAKKLQVNQNKLPQHLQDAIKAAPESPAKFGPLAAIAGKALIGAAVNKLASSNKMRSGFKMKGYGKK
jgi:hypothetical protein